MSLLGELNDLGLSDIFQILALSQRTGTLVVTTPSYVGQAVFASGQVVAGGLSAHTMTVGEHLVHRKVLTTDNLAEVTLAERRGASGLALLDLCQQPSERILVAMEEMLRGVMNRLLCANQGTFNFENAAHVEPWQLFSVSGTVAVCPRGLKAQYLAMEAMRARDEAQRPAQALGHPPSQPQAKSARGLSLGQPHMQDGPQEDDWSALMSDIADDAGKSAAPAARRKAEDGALAQLRDLLYALKASPAGPARCALLLRALQLHCERGAYFDVRDGALRSCACYPQKAVAKARVPLTHDSAQGQVCASGQAMLQPLPPTSAHQALFTALGGPWHQGAVLVAPWHEAGRVVGLLVGDNPSGKPLTDAPGVDIVVAQAAFGGAPQPGPRA